MRALDNLSIKLKLILLPALCLLLLLASAGLTLWGSEQLGSALQSLYSQRLPSHAFAARVEADVRDLNGLINQSLALEAVGYSAAEVAVVDEAIVATGERLQAALQERMAMVEPPEREALAAIDKALKAYRKSIADTVDLKSSGLATAATFLTVANGQYAVLLKAVSQISASQLQRAGEEVAQAQAGSRRLQFLTLLASAAAVAIALLSSAAIASGMLRRVRRLSAAMRALGDGDLSRRIESQGRDEIGTLMRDAEAVRERLAGSLRSVRAASESVRSAAGEIAHGNTSLGQRTETTSASLQQTAASMHQLTDAVNENALASQRASDAASGVALAARASGTVVARVVQTMGDISGASRRIAEITGVIDGIAFQTNILALNAAVEAARAGEQGRGFAVVAAEVRNLAQRSAAAAKEIKGLIGESVDKVEAGTRLVDAAGQTMQEIVASVKKVSDLVAEIAAASAEQDSGIQQVNTAVAQMDQVVQQNASLVEE
ncbi:MAG: hypothetical protein JWP65_2863, partial [Ramlibacter sp.]|uniref:methyl-accepting chemotaxis protein n=1 Tax=Ramlibacter sp. TaxID=1917967 RepID=UPI0026358B8B